MARFFRLLLRLGQGTASRLRNWWYRGLGTDIRGYCWMRGVRIERGWPDIRLHGCSLDHGVVLLTSGAPSPAKIEIEAGTYINRYTIIDAHQRIHIGRNVMIGPHCFITDGNHGMEPGRSVKSQPMTSQPVEIGEGAWIGAHVTILPGVRVGAGAVIGAGSVVTRDVPPNVIAIGTPAKVLRSRDQFEFKP